ncbi:MAG TPA: DUF6275 family protein [Candidatus Pelethenecus sp.]|nr:DUF6275 family protein [Candidatus Pelethenecus sp.]
MDNNQFEKHCKKIVLEQLNNDPNITQSITEEDIYIVWSCKILQNNKALVSSKVSGCPYYEITYNGDKEETYVDAYKKIANICL